MFVVNAMQAQAQSGFFTADKLPVVTLPGQLENTTEVGVILPAVENNTEVGVILPSLPEGSDSVVTLPEDNETSTPVPVAWVNIHTAYVENIEAANTQTGFWESNPLWYNARPNGGSYECRVVGWESKYPTSTEGSYAACVLGSFKDARLVETCAEKECLFEEELPEQEENETAPPVTLPELDENNTITNQPWLPYPDYDGKVYMSKAFLHRKSEELKLATPGVNQYWTQLWTWMPEMPHTQAYECELVSWAGNYKAAAKNGYAACIKGSFANVEVVEDCEDKVCLFGKI